MKTSLAPDVKVYWVYYPVYLLYWYKSTNTDTPENAGGVRVYRLQSEVRVH